MSRDGLTKSSEGRWTRPEDYMAALARKRGFRRDTRQRRRTEPEAPTLGLSTLPFVALLALLAVLAFSIMIAAVPQAAPVRAPERTPQREQGVATKGWFQEAQKEFRS